MGRDMMQPPIECGFQFNFADCISGLRSANGFCISSHVESLLGWRSGVSQQTPEGLKPASITLAGFSYFPNLVSGTRCRVCEIVT
jgi:hypothetical protein